MVMVSVPRPEGAAAAHDSVPLGLHKALLWSQDDPILDVAVLEEGATPTRIAVLDADGPRWLRVGDYPRRPVNPPPPASGPAFAAEAVDGTVEGELVSEEEE